MGNMHRFATLAALIALAACGGDATVDEAAAAGAAGALSDPSGRANAGASGKTQGSAGAAGAGEQMSDGRLLLEFGDATVEIDPTTGARIARCFQGIGGDAVELHTGPEIHPLNYGTTFWTSPQATWGWPPVEAVDSAPYEARAAADGSVELRGPIATVGEARLRVSKRFQVVEGAAAGGAAAALRVDYVIENVGDASTSVAPWEISRVPAAGLSFYSRGEGEAIGTLQLTEVQGIAWFDHATWETGQDQKVGTDGKGGWVAHVVRAGAVSVLLLKQFEDIAADASAPNQGEVELFSNHDGKYVEVEQQGAYVSLPAGATTTWTVLWKVERLAPDLDVSVGSTALLEAVEALL